MEDIAVLKAEIDSKLQKVITLPPTLLCVFVRTNTEDIINQV